MADMKSPKKLRGGEAFDKLLGTVVHVPKKEVDRAAKAWKKSRAKKKRKPGGSG